MLDAKGTTFEETVSIPNRELVGFQRNCEFVALKVRGVSIPNRELVGFQQEGQILRMGYFGRLFQSLIGN